MCTENKKIDPKQYNYACYLLQSGECSTAKEVAEIVDIPVATLRARFRKDGIKKPTSLKASDLDDSSDQGKKLKAVYLNSLNNITRRALTFAQRSVTDNIPLGNFNDDLRALKLITDIANKNYATCAKILNVDEIVDAEELPEFTVVEMTASDVEEVRQVQRAQFRELSTTEETESRH
ncbi:TPA: hypothetical protein I7142_19560 [Vibrio vulnificus]|uniref:hypothetical protein n=1 Tax=Vibrio vulnificus TaxID=672 RepID=UPI0019D4C073|nr:hypothetical protein [Vibrio vulnificus]MBN8094400.1 hypothetical protein [Vibrio vulnificus]HAS6026171.1 hypothetical protein [Vibrio vulnificus]HAS6036040.1 hypothetical protein [Vibrio vulnificus]